MLSLTNEENQAAIEQALTQLEEGAAKVDFVLTEGERIQKQAIETMNKAIPMIVTHLNPYLLKNSKIS